MIVTIIIDITIEMIIISITIIKKFCVLRKGILSSVWGYSAESVYWVFCVGTFGK